VVRPRGSTLLAGTAFGLLLLGLGAHLLGRPEWARLAWTVGLYAVGVPLVWRTGRGVLQGRFAADLVAALAILGAMVLSQPFAGLIVCLMQAGGEALERRAEARATEAVRMLEDAAPRFAHRRAGPSWEDIALDAVRPGDEILVRPGEMLPCDGTVLGGTASVEVSRITGESIPVSAREGVALRSGGIVLDGPLTLRVTAAAGESLYARIVEMVRTAQASKAPLQRLADRVAVWFTPATLAVCAGAWLVSGDPSRVLAVLVVATPCPLILATPVAVIGGINRAARRGIITRHGGALEALARVDTAVFDKTGTVTLGEPELLAVQPRPGFEPDELLELAAAIESGSGHRLARSVVRGAVERGVPVRAARDIREDPGRGVEGRVDDRVVLVGSFSWLRERAPEAAQAMAGRNGSARRGVAFVAVDGRAAGRLEFADRPRSDAREALARLEGLGITHQVLLSGDDRERVEDVARELGFTELHAEQLPQDKVTVVEALRRGGRRVLMVGDGINDAPALSVAQVGVAVAEHGGGIAAESADVVLLGDQLSGVADAVAIGRQTMRIARQSLYSGLGLSAVAMLVAALGHIPPAAGALLQEGIDLAVILNAVRAAGDEDPFTRVSRWFQRP